MGSSGKLGEPTVSSINSRIGIIPAQQDPRLRVRFSPVTAKKEKAVEVIGAERNAKAERRTEAVLVS